MSTSVDVNRVYTPEEWLELPEAERFELVDGHPVENNVSFLSSWTEGRIYQRIAEFVGEERGWVLPSSMLYRCFPHRPALMRKPDVSFLSAERFRPSDVSARILTIAPDLAVEVVSPNDEAEELEIRVRDYLKAGVPLVWVVFPVARSARVHRADGSISGVEEDGGLEGENVLPGFLMRLREVLPPVPKPEQEPEQGG